MFKNSDFKKSSFSVGPPHYEGCVEVAIKDGKIAVRDSKNRSQQALVFNEYEWECFLAGVKNREFELK